MDRYKTINENIDQIIQVIVPRHVTEYDWLVQNIDDAKNDEYQKRYKKYWQLHGAGLDSAYCETYFQHLQAGLAEGVPPLGVLAHQLYQTPINTNRRALQFSFCTKLCHMLDRRLPIYDSIVRNFYGFNAPGITLSLEQRVQKLVQFHQFLVVEYEKVLDQRVLGESIAAFRQCFAPECFTDEKVIDSLIWASSSKPSRQ